MSNASRTDEEQNNPSMPEDNSMRSDLVFDPMAYVSKRFLLTMLSATTRGR
jgi:hypothetical protein